jgi:hypothetical protein
MNTVQDEEDASSSSRRCSPPSGEEKKTVSFSRKAKVRGTIANQDISEEESLATWYTADEYDGFLESFVKQVRKLDNGTQLMDTKYCARGLESHTKVRSLAKSKNRLLSIRAVLEEQDRQLKCGIWNEQLFLAHAYTAVSASCQVWANVVGLKDQREAENIMDCCFQDSWQEEEPVEIIAPVTPIHARSGVNSIKKQKWWSKSTIHVQRGVTGDLVHRRK